MDKVHRIAAARLEGEFVRDAATAKSLFKLHDAYLDDEVGRVFPL